MTSIEGLRNVLREFNVRFSEVGAMPEVFSTTASRMLQFTDLPFTTIIAELRGSLPERRQWETRLIQQRLIGELLDLME